MNKEEISTCVLLRRVGRLRHRLQAVEQLLLVAHNATALVAATATATNVRCGFPIMQPHMSNRARHAMIVTDYLAGAPSAACLGLGGGPLVRVTVNAMGYSEMCDA